MIVSRVKIRAWISPTNMSNNFHTAFGSHRMYAGISAMIATMIPPAKMLPNSRSASETGREKYSVMNSIGASARVGLGQVAEVALDARWPGSRPRSPR